jgi:hypothetical protein
VQTCCHFDSCLQKTLPFQALGHDISHNGRFLRPFLAISAANVYNTSKAENMSVLVVFSRRKLVLDNDAYLRWLDQCGFSDSTRTLLTSVDRS